MPCREKDVYNIYTTDYIINYFVMLETRRCHLILKGLMASDINYFGRYYGRNFDSLILVSDSGYSGNVRTVVTAVMRSSYSGNIQTVVTMVTLRQ